MQMRRRHREIKNQNEIAVGQRLNIQDLNLMTTLDEVDH